MREEYINLETIIPEEKQGQRLDQALAALFPDYSRSRLQKWITSQQVTLDGKPCQIRSKVKGGEKIIVHATLPKTESWQAQAIDLDIVHEDDDLLIINKPVGLVVHPAAGHADNTLLNALLHHVPDLNQLPRAGIIHRLDKETSGLLVVAKTLITHTDLVKKLQKRDVTREYEAIAEGVIIAGNTIDAPIGRHPVKRKNMAVVETGKPAVTHYRVLERFPAHTRIAVKLETGRTHQIRVHMAHIHHPLLGDPTYGKRLRLPKNATPSLVDALRNFKHQALHAKRLGFIHPTTKEYVEWSINVPPDFQAMIDTLREDK